jgi:hypothetical protein
VKTSLDKSWRQRPISKGTIEHNQRKIGGLNAPVDQDRSEVLSAVAVEVARCAVRMVVGYRLLWVTVPCLGLPYVVLALTISIGRRAILGVLRQPGSQYFLLLSA